MGVECDYNRSLRWCNGTRLPRARRQGRRQPSQADSSLERERESSATTSPADSNFAPHESPETPRYHGISLEGTIREADSPSGPESPPAERSPERPDESLQGEIIYGSRGSSYGPLTPTSTFAGQQLCDTRGATANSEEEAELVAARNSEAAFALQNPLDGHLCSMLFQDNGSYLAYLYCKNPLLPALCSASQRNCYPPFCMFDLTKPGHAVVRSVALILPGWSGVRNGYRQLAALSLSSPTLLDTIVSVSTIYMHLRGIVPRSLALRRQSHALASLRRSVTALASRTSEVADAEASCLKRDVLATILLQITVEIANGTSFIQTHITHALTLFRELGYERARPTSPVGHVLLQRITFIDTLSAIFWRRRPLLPLSFWFLNQPEDLQPDGQVPSFQETTGCPLPIIAVLSRISHLAADYSEGLSTEAVMTRAYAIEGDLAFFARTSSSSHSVYEADDARHLDTVGQCYYWSAAILLQRTIFLDAHDSHRVQFCLARLLDLIEALPIGCGPDSQLSLPLYAAALAAGDEEQREAIRRKNERLSEAYPMKSRSALSAVFEGMWGAMDRQDDGGGCGRVEAVSDMMKERALFIC